MKTVLKIIMVLALITAVIFSIIACEAASPHDDNGYEEMPATVPSDTGDASTPAIPPSHPGVPGSQEEGMENALISFRRLIEIDDDVSRILVTPQCTQIGKLVRG